MKGRKRKPAALRELHASRKRPHHQDEPEIPASVAEVAADVVVPDPPEALTKAALAYWSRFAPLLAGAKVLTPADVETLADYCRACVAVEDRGRRLDKELRKRVMDAATVRMLDQQMRGWVEKKTKLAAELGLTAVSRTRVAWSGHGQILDPVKKPQSTLARLQAQAREMRRPVAVS